jgi:hypothetical protein
VRKWVYFGAAIILGLALYASGAIEGLALALLGVTSAGASRLISTRRETDKILDGMKETTKKYDDLKSDYEKEVERIEKSVADTGDRDLVYGANERERRRPDTTLR